MLKTERALDAVQTLSLYMILLQAEGGFACLKGTLGLRPNFHQLEHRVEAPMLMPPPPGCGTLRASLSRGFPAPRLISVLAYHLLTWVRETLRHSGAPRDWNSLRRLLSTHCLITTVLPLNTGTVLRIRKPSQPDAKQQHLYDNLGIDWRTAFPAIKTTTTP